MTNCIEIACKYVFECLKAEDLPDYIGFDFYWLALAMLFVVRQGGEVLQKRLSVYCCQVWAKCGDSQESVEFECRLSGQHSAQ